MMVALRALLSLAKMEPKVSAPCTNTAEMTFSVTCDYPDKVVDCSCGRIVGKRGQQGVYSLHAMNLSHGDLKLLNAVRPRLTNALAAMGELPTYSKGGIATAQR